MTTLHIVRHGETEWNVLKKMQGQHDSPLTSRGRSQAITFKQHFTDPIDVAYSSPSGRALETASIIMNGETDRVQTAAELLEINLGIWEGRTLSDVKETFPQEYKHFWENPARFQVDQAETFRELQDRSVNFVANLLQSNRGKTVLLVSHTTTIKVILAYFEGRPLEKIWDPPFITNCSHSIIKATTENGFQVVSYGGESTW